MRKGQAKFIFLGLVAFVVLCLLASPMPTNEMGQSFDNQMGVKENIDDFDSKQIYTLSDGESWLSGWLYRQSHVITGSTGAGTNYQMKFHVEYNAASSSGNIVDCNSHCQTDFGDIRFTDNDGNTQLDYWIEEKTDSDDATFWVEVKDDLGSNQVIYVYYGTSGTTSTTSDGDATFLWFDNFNGASLDTNKWTLTQGAVTFASGHLVLTGTSGTRAIIECDTTFTYNTMITVGQTYASMTRPYPCRFLAAYSSTAQFNDRMDMFQYGGANAIKAYVGNDGTSDYGTHTLDGLTTATNYYISYTSSSVSFIEDGGTIVTKTTNIPNDNMCQLFYEGLVTSGAHTVHIDWTYGRKYIASEPAHSTWGSEEEANAIPVNDATPVCTNLDDTDNLYARYKLYEFSCSVTDADGYADINYVELRSYDYGTTTLRWTVRYNETSDAFSEQAGASYIGLSGSTRTKSGVNLDITFKIYIEWAHPDVNDDDLYQYVIDESADPDGDSYPNTNYDYDTDLTTTFTLNDGSGTADHGNYNSIDSITASGTVSYEDSGGNNYPTTAEVDMYIRCTTGITGDWNDTTLTSGYWEMTVDSDDVIGLDTYYVKAVQAGGNYDSATLLGATTSDTYKADRVRVVSYTIVTPSGDNRNNIGTTYTIDVELHYDLYETDVVDGTVTVNGESMDSYQGSGKWRWTPTQAGVTGITYNNVQVTGNAKGITKEDNTVTQLIIWDRIKVMSYTIVNPAGDNRNNIGTTYTIDIELHYDYDETDVADGTITVNGESMDSYQGSGKWRWTPYQAGVIGITYNNMQATGNTHGITVEDNTVTQLIIWDRVKVVSYTIVTPSGDNRNNIGTTYTIDIELHYDYDETDVADGTITVNGESMDSYQGSGKWRWTPTQAGVTGITYNNMQATGNTHGITAEDNTVTQLIIWDRIQVQSYSVSDSRQNININVNIDATLWYDYDNTQVTDGTVTINGYSASHQGSGVWRITRTSASVADVTYNNVQATGNTHGITTEDQNGQSTTVIWDQIRVVSYTIVTPSGDNRNNIGTTYTIDVELHYDYNEADLTDGTVTINGLTGTYQSLGKWRFTKSESTVMDTTYNNVQATGNTYGITIEDNTVTQQVIWDRIQVQSYSVSDARDDINDNVNIDATLWYDYDNALVTDGTVTINGYAAAHQGSGVWRITRTSATVTAVTYNNVQASGNTHGITTEDQNGQSQQVIWDRIQVQSYSVSDARDNINDNVNIDVTLWYDYDDTQVTDGTVTINGYSAAHQGSGVWRITRTSVSVTSITYNVVVVSGNTHGITEEDQNGQSTTVIWDRVQVQSYSVTDSRVNINDNVNIDVTLWYDYDNTLVTDGTVTINAFSAVHQGSGVWRITRTSTTVSSWTYSNVQTSGNIHGITTEDQNGQSQQVIWDRIKILTTSATSNYIEYGTESTTVNVTAELNYDSHLLGASDTLYMNNTLMTWDTDHFYIVFGPYNVFDSWELFVNSSSANEVTYGITVIWLNGQSDTVATDRVKVISYVISDARDNVDDYIWINVTVQYESDSSAITDGTIVVNGYSFSHLGSGIWRHNRTESSVGDITFNTVVAAGNTRGIIVVNQNGQSQLAIWDQIKILGYSTNSTDNRDNIGTCVNISVWIQYDYDDVNVTDGTIVINSESFAYNAGSGNWTALFSNATYSYATWNTVVASGNEHGITNVNQNSKSQLYVWDEIEVYYGIVEDGRTNYGETEHAGFRLRLKYNVGETHYLNDASNDAVSINGSAAAWVADVFDHWEIDYSYSAVVRYYFIVTSASENTYGITVFDSTSASSYIQNIIWDRVIVMDYTTNSTDNHDNINDCFNVSVWIQYEYDSTNVTDGTIVINSDSFAYNAGTGNWTALFSNATVSDATWDTIVVSGNTHGITYENQNGKSQTVVWDRVQVQTTVVDDGRVDYGTTAQIRVTLWLDYDDSYLGSGDTVNLNGTGMSWDAGNSWFELNRTFSVVGEWGFFVNSTSEVTYSITALDLNGQSVNVIWDRIKITATAATDGRIDYGTATTINVTAVLEHDSHALGSGDTLYMNDTQMTWDTNHYYITTGSYSIVDIINYFVNSSSANEATYGITVVNLDGNSANVIWDRIKILTTTATDGRIDYGTTTTLNVTAELEYDSHALGSGDTLYMNDTSMTWDTNHFYLVTGSYNIVDLINYFVNSSNANEVTHGITVINLDSNNAEVIWDRIKITATGSTDGRIDYGTTTTINVTATLEYAAHSLGSGDTLYMNGTSMTWDTDHFYLVTGAYNIVDIINYFVNSSSANEATYGITVINLDGNNADVIWDRIKILTTTVTDGRIDYGTSTTVNVTAELEYDSHGLGSGDTLYMNDTQMTWDTDHFYLTTGSYNIVDIINYFVNSSSANEATHGITVINLDGNNDDVIWDRILILTTAVTDGRINYGIDTTTLNVTARLEYNTGGDHNLGSGDTLYMNDTSMTWNTDHFYLVTGSYSIVDIINYFVNSSSANEATYGITVINLDGNSANVIWDRVQVQSYTVTDSWVDVDVNVNVDVLLYYDYDNSDVTDGTVTLNGNAMAHQGTGTWRYTTNETSPAANIYDTIVVSGNTHGITVEDQQGLSHEVLWDRVIWQSVAHVNTTQDYGSDGYRVNEGIYVRITLQLQYEYNNTNLIDGTVTLNGESMTYNTTPGFWYLDVMNSTSAYGQHYNFTTIAVSGNAQGITIENQNSQSLSVIWDEIVVLTTAATDSYIDPTETTTINVTAQLRYDNHTVGNGDTLRMNDTNMVWDTDHWYLTVGPYGGVYILTFFVNSTSNNESTYAITVIDVDGKSATIGSERVKVISYAISDARDNVDDYIWINVTVQYESDSAAVVDGTITILGYSFSHLGSGVWRHNRTESTVVGRTFDTVVVSGNTRSITTVNQNGQSQLAIWDRIIILTTTSTDGRINYGTTTTINVTATLEYAAHSLGSGDTLYMNDTSMTWDTDHYYITTGAYNIVDIINYFVNSSSASEVTYGISVVNLDGNDADVIWDRILILTTVATDGRIDYGTTTMINVTAELEYDSHALGAGDTLYMNDTSMVWDTDHFYITTGAYNIVDIINYFVNSSSANEATYTITVVNVDGNSDDVIWDRIKILTTVTDDSRVGYDTQATIAVTAQLEYDYHVLGSGDTLYMNGTQMTWNGTHFILNPQFTDVDIWSFYVNSSNANEATYGITAVNLDGNSANQIWDRVVFTWNSNMTWTIVNYNINVSFTAIHEYDSAVFAGNLTAANCTITNSTTPYEVLTETPYENYTYYTTSVIDDVYGIAAYINTVTAWCVFDNITATAIYGTDTGTYTNTFWISFGMLKWQYNSSGIGADWICDNIRNGTALTFSTTRDDSLLSPDIKQEISVSVDWDAILYSNNATKTIDGRSYDFQWYSVTQVIAAIQDIMQENTEILDTIVVISGTTNVDFTWTVYNEDVASGETGTVSDSNNWEIVFDMVMVCGIHNYSIYFDASDSGDRWINNSYFIDFDVNVDLPEVMNVNVEVRGTINIACSYYIYHEDVYSEQTGLLTPTTFSFLFTAKTDVGLHNYSLYFNTSAIIYEWKNGSYYVSSVWDFSKVTLYNSEGTGLDVDHFIVYVNGTRYYGNKFYGRTDYSYNITVTDYFGYTIYSNTFVFDRYLSVGIAFYVYKVQSELQGQAVYFNLTRTGGARFSQHLLSDEIISYYLVAGEYTYEFRKVAHDLMAPTYIYYEGTFTLGCDKTHIIDGTNLRDLENDIELIPAGKADIKPLEEKMGNILGMISIMQFGMWGLAFLIVMGMAATATDEEITKDGKIVKKRKIPKQLKKFAFGRGSKNPKSKKIPKGAGRSGWTGVVFRDEIKDWRDKM